MLRRKFCSVFNLSPVDVNFIVFELSAGYVLLSLRTEALKISPVDLP